MRTLLAALIAALLAACGFQLRGAQPLPFESLHIAIAENSELGAQLKRNIRAAGGTRLVDAPQEAQAILAVAGELREKSILSLSSAGRVREFQLRYRFAFRVHDLKGREYIPLNEIVLTRDISFSDTQVLAKEQEEVLLYRDMQNDLVQQLMRRLAAVKLQG
jgi:LPS-assembly lipoprotein